MSEEKNNVRPSALPKLKECRCFVGSSEPSEAAERGTLIDEVIREVFNDVKNGVLELGQVKDHAHVCCLEPDEMDAVIYGVQVLMRYHVRFGDVLTMEQDLAAITYTDEVENGTMDALSVAGKTVIDIKTGQMRNYREQMAAYCMAMMREHFEGDWNYLLVFVDQGETREGSFTFQEAQELIAEIVSAPEVPSACEYCKWCAKLASCPEMVKQVEGVEAAAALLPQVSEKKASEMAMPDQVLAMVEDEALAWEFLGMCSVAEAWKKQLVKKLKEKADKVPLTHFTLVKQAGRKTVCSVASLTEYFEGNVPDGLINQGAASIQLRRVSNKKKLELEQLTEQ